jgi:hypothetical protein
MSRTGRTCSPAGWSSTCAAASHGRYLALPFGAMTAGAESDGLAGQRQTAFIGVLDLDSDFGIRALPGYSAPSNPGAAVSWQGNNTLMLEVPDVATGEVRVAFLPYGGTNSPIILPWVFPVKAGVTIAP